MRQQRKDLQPFNMVRLEEIRKLRSEMYCGGDNKLFWDELEAIITSEDYTQSDEWERMNNDDVVLGEVWSQPIGEFYYKNTVHRFAYLYVESQGLAIGEHGHSEPIQFIFTKVDIKLQCIDRLQNGMFFLMEVWSYAENTLHTVLRITSASQFMFFPSKLVVMGEEPVLFNPA